MDSSSCPTALHTTVFIKFVCSKLTAFTGSYGSQRGSEIGQLSWPRRLAVDADSQFIFVADHCNRRVVLLSPTLEFVRYFREGMLQPRRLYLHQATRRLFVGQSHGFIAVIQL